MTNQITIQEFKTNYEHYQKRMDNGEVFTFLDYDETKHTLMDPVGGKGLPINVIDIGLQGLTRTYFYSKILTYQYRQMSITQKFHKYLPLLEETVEGTVFLDLKNPKLYKKLIRHYANEGVEFYDDGNEYATIVQCIAEDLGTNEE